jgi:predicted PurR-regulated permease PerM
MSLSITTPLIIAGAIVAFVVLVGLYLVFRDTTALQRRIESLFRRPPRPPKTAGDEQYYRPYWSR